MTSRALLAAGSRSSAALISRRMLATTDIPALLCRSALPGEPQPMRPGHTGALPFWPGTLQTDAAQRVFYSAHVITVANIPERAREHGTGNQDQGTWQRRRP